MQCLKSVIRWHLFSFSSIENRAVQMAWDWSGADTPMPGLWTGLGIWDIIRQSVPASQDTWQRDKRDSCDNVNSNISLLFCGGKVSPQNVSIVRDRGTGLRSISTSDSLHFHFNWHLNYQRFNFISVNIKTDSVQVHLSLNKIYQQTITISTEN